MIVLPDCSITIIPVVRAILRDGRVRLADCLTLHIPSMVLALLDVTCVTTYSLVLPGACHMKEKAALVHSHLFDPGRCGFQGLASFEGLPRLTGLANNMRLGQS